VEIGVILFLFFGKFIEKIRMNTEQEMTYRQFALDMGHLAENEVLADKAGPFYQVWTGAMLRDGVYPFECPRNSDSGTHVEISHAAMAEIRVINFSSYNYLGYAHDHAVKQAAKDAIDIYGTGSGGSPILNGKTQVFRDLILKKLAKKKFPILPIRFSGLLLYRLYLWLPSLFRAYLDVTVRQCRERK
jgi:hypothetical protein